MATRQYQVALMGFHRGKPPSAMRGTGRCSADGATCPAPRAHIDAPEDVFLSWCPAKSPNFLASPEPTPLSASPRGSLTGRKGRLLLPVTQPLSAVYATEGFRKPVAVPFAWWDFSKQPGYPRYADTRGAQPVGAATRVVIPTSSRPPFSGATPPGSSSFLVPVR